MGQFKPMVKMKTTEPSVILKLKKGGSVANPKKMATGGMTGYLQGVKNKIEAPAPRRGTGPNDAGPMGPRPIRQRPLPKRGTGPNDAGPGRPLVKPLVSRHPDDFGLKAPGMKHGGEMESAKMHTKEKKSISNIEKKLSKHADMPASKGHKGLKTGGVVKGQGGYKTGGVVNGQGGFKDGGAAKKHYATGGSVESGAPVAMPERKKSAPVAIDRLAGTFKKGGKVRGGMAC